MPRQSYWDNTLVSQSIATGGQAVIDLSGTPGALSEGFTLVRTIFDLYILPNSGTPSANGSQMLDIGVGLTSKEAFAASVVPDPNDPTERPVQDYIYRTRCVVMQDDTQVLAPTMCRGDIRAGRKLAGGTLYMAIDSIVLTGSSFTIRVAGLVRCLILRP